ncbi:MAG: hypothetical protein ACE5R6_13410 [Candidatus Heimdallarchaeota archaeon]
MGLTTGNAFILNQNVFTLLILIVLLLGLVNGLFVVWKYKNALAANWNHINKEKSSIKINSGFNGFIIAFVVLVTLLLIEHHYIKILIDSVLIFTIIVIGFYGILSVILVRLSTKMECINPSQNACITRTGLHIQIESSK